MMETMAACVIGLTCGILFLMFRWEQLTREIVQVVRDEWSKPKE